MVGLLTEPPGGYGCHFPIIVKEAPGLSKYHHSFSEDP